MGQDVIDVISGLMSNTYRLLTNVAFPGTNYSIMGLMILTVILCFLIGIVRYIFGFSFGEVEHSYRSAIRGGNNRKIKVSNERKGDTR